MVENDDAGDETSKIPIVQLKWLPSQPSTGEACLFALLNARNMDVEVDYLKSTIVGLKSQSHSGIESKS